MNSEAFLNFSNNTQIATSLALIVALLTYIAFKLSEDKKKSTKSK